MTTVVMRGGERLVVDPGDSIGVTYFAQYCVFVSEGARYVVPFSSIYLIECIETTKETAQ